MTVVPGAGKYEYSKDSVFNDKVKYSMGKKIPV